MQKAKIILKAAEGLSNKRISQELCMSYYQSWLKQGVPIVSEDEKTGIQAQERVHPQMFGYLRR